jgi:hypothetical protein
MVLQEVFCFLWDSRVLEMADLCVGMYSLSVLFKNVEDGYTWAFSGVYGSNDDSFRRMLLPEVIQRRLPRLYSDHFPILLDSGLFGGGKKPFIFENMWLKVEGFVDRIREWWSSYDFAGSPSFVLGVKLKVLKQDLKVWNKDVFGDLSSRKLSLLREISSLDGLDEEGRLDTAGVDRKLNIMRDLDQLLDLEEVSWRQKSRALWLKEGAGVRNSSIVLPIHIEKLTLSLFLRWMGSWWKTLRIFHRGLLVFILLCM